MKNEAQKTQALNPQLMPFARSFRIVPPPLRDDGPKVFGIQRLVAAFVDAGPDMIAMPAEVPALPKNARMSLHSERRHALVPSSIKEELETGAFLRRRVISRTPCSFIIILLVGCLLAGCRTTFPLTTFNTSEPGWEVRQGQAVWRSRYGANEIAGELLLATHPDQRCLLEFSKTPLPILTAQITARQWRIQFVTGQRTIAGSGQPPTSLAWLHLARCLKGNVAPLPLEFYRLQDGTWRLENTKTGVMISGFLTP